MPETTQTSVFELCVTKAVARYGMLKGGRIGGRQAAFVIEWAQYMRDTGDDPGHGRAYSRWANVSHATAARRLLEFRELFPEDGHETPAPLAQYVTLKPAKRGRRSGSALPA